MITSVTEIQSALHGAPTHETLVSIADFGSKHLLEMQKLNRDEKKALYSRLVTENYDNKELSAVIAVADQFFKEKLGEKEGDLTKLSPTARLHLFRYMEQNHLEMTTDVLALLNMPKRQREMIVYRSFFTPLLSKLKGEELKPPQ